MRISDWSSDVCSSDLGGIDEVPALVTALRRALGEFLSACEVMSKAAIDVALRHNPGVKNPFHRLPEQAVLVEVSTGLDNSVVDADGVLLGAAENLFA